MAFNPESVPDSIPPPNGKSYEKPLYAPYTWWEDDAVTIIRVEDTYDYTLPDPSAAPGCDVIGGPIPRAPAARMQIKPLSECLAIRLRIVVLEFDPASCLWHYMVMPLCSINQHSEKDALRNLNIGGDDFGMRGRVLSEVCPKLDRDAYSSSAGRSLWRQYI